MCHRIRFFRTIKVGCPPNNDNSSRFTLIKWKSTRKQYKYGICSDYPKNSSNFHTSAMNKSKIRVLSEYNPYLRLLSAYNPINNSDQRDRHYFVRNAFGATMNIFFLFTFSLSISWHAFANGIDLKKFVVALPLVMSIVRMAVTFIALMLKNSIISETIDQLQRVVDQREWPFPFFR